MTESTDEETDDDRDWPVFEGQPVFKGRHRDIRREE